MSFIRGMVYSPVKVHPGKGFSEMRYLPCPSGCYYGSRPNRTWRKKHKGVIR